MSRKKKIYKKKGKIIKDLTKNIFKILNTDSSKHYNYKQISAKLGVSDTDGKTQILQKLVELTGSKKIKEIDRGKFQINNDRKYHIGTLDITSNGNGYFISDDFEKDIFIPSNNLGKGLQNDTVKAYIYKRNRSNKQEADIVEIIERDKTSFVGVLQLSKNFGFVICDNNKMYTDIFVPRSKINNADHGDKVQVTITDWPENSKNPFGKITQVLGKPGDHNTEIHSILLEYGLPYEFEIGIHIADVSHYVQPDTILDTEAFSRATSVYLVDRVVPMLPEILSNGACSLRPNEEKLTFSAVFEINNKAKIINKWFGRTVTYSDKRFAYEEAQAIIETKKNHVPSNVSITGEAYDVKEEISDAILKLNELSKILRENRMKNGAISFDRVEVKFNLDKDANPVGVYFKEAKDANKLIEEFMLLANRKVAEFIGKKNNQPSNKTFIYRVHDEPDIEKLATLQNIVYNFGYKMDTQTRESTTQSLNKLLKDVHGKAEANMIETLAIRSMSKAVYTTQNIGHYGLAFNYYSHFTSPIRRYPDVMTHRLLQHYLDGKNSPKQDDYEVRCKHTSKQEELASKAERQSIKYMQVKYMQDHLDEEFTGVISGVTEWGIYVEITSNKCEGMVRIRDIKNDYYIFDEKQHAIVGQTTKHIYQLGDEVIIKVKNTDLERKHLDFTLIEQ